MTRLKTSLLTIAVLLFTLAVSAHDFEVDGIYYNITSDSDLTVSVTFQGDSYNSYFNEYSGDVVIPEKVTYSNKEYSVTSIGYRAFDGCTSLTNVSIPDSVTSIENYAFEGCSGLTSIDIPKSVKYIGVGVFSVCNNLPSIKVESGNTNYDSRDNCNAIIETNTNKLIAGCKNTVIPNSVTSIGSRAFYNCSGLTSIDIPNSVTSIGNYAFYNCSSLTSIDIPNSVTSIGTYAFSRCSGLTSIDIPNSVTSIGNYAFSRCSGLTSVTIGNSVTSIGYNSFYYCLSLTNVTIGSSVTSIGSHAFYACKNLTSVTIPNSVTSIGDYAFRGCSALTNVTIPNSVISIGNYAFYVCKNLMSVEIPNSVTNIGREAFAHCSGLTSVTIGRSVTNIGFWAFYNCSGLTTINIDSDNTIYDSRDNCNAIIETKTNTLIAGCKNTVIPNYVTTIGDYAFLNCSGLTNVIIPNSVTSIGIQAFYGCSGLTSLKVDSGNVKYDSRDNCNAIIETSTNTLYIGCKNTVIPNTVTSIGYFAFESCSGLTSVTIPNSVTSIGIYAFYDCSGLTSVTIPNSVTSIGEQAFCDCSGLTSVTIGNSVTSIGNDAFHGCSGLTSVTIPNSVTNIGSRAFYDCSGLTSVTIPNSVTSIGNSAFGCCSDLTSVTIPNSVTSIGRDAFSRCSSLTSVTVEHSTPLPVEYNTFALYKHGEYITNNATLYVPYGSAAAYQSSEGWSTFTCIEEMPGAQFIIPETAAYPDEQLSLPVEMSNTAELTAFQCDVYIPEGLTLQTDDKGRYDITLSSERCDDHTLSALLQSDGSIRIAMYSMSTSPILGTEGPLFTLNMSAGEELSAYEVQIKNIHASDASGKLYSMADVTGTVTVDYRAGDANGDGMVAVNDVVYTVNKILNNAAEDFIFSAADMNDDNEIMINDVVMIVNTILGTSTTTAALAPRHMNAFETLSVADSRTAYGMTEFGITLSNASRYTAMQFDMEIAEGADIADIKVSMPTDHSVAFRRIDDTTVRVVVTSLTNEALTEGTQLSISMKDAAGKTVAFTNGRAAYNNGQMVGIMPGSTILGGTTGIDGVNAEFAPADVYSIDGRIVKKNATTLDGLQPGVYVVNGRKVVVER